MSADYDILQDTIFEHHAQFCRVCSSPTRLRIMALLNQRPRSVSELSHDLKISLANTSQHLRIMREQRAVLCERAGKSNVYRIANPKFIAGGMLIRTGVQEQQDLSGPTTCMAVTETP